MSILIKSIDMPKNGELTIAFASNKNGENTTALILDGKGNPVEHKGVTEIPTPHGRLIDADKLLKSIDIMREQRCKTCSSRIDTKHCDRNGCWMIFISDFIGSLPTIIEAEVSE